MSIERGSTVVGGKVKFNNTEANKRSLVLNVPIRVDNFGDVTAVSNLNITIEFIDKNVLRINVFGGSTICENAHNAWHGSGYIYARFLDKDENQLVGVMKIPVSFTGKGGNGKPVPENLSNVIFDEESLSDTRLIRGIDFEAIDAVAVFSSRFSIMSWLEAN